LSKNLRRKTVLGRKNHRAARQPSDDDDDVLGIETLDGPAERFDRAGTGVAQRDKQDLVALQVNDLMEPTFKADQIRCGQSTQKYGILPAKTEVLAGLGDVS
jgi:hypothetical protein